MGEPEGSLEERGPETQRGARRCPKPGLCEQEQDGVLPGKSEWSLFVGQHRCELTGVAKGIKAVGYPSLLLLLSNRTMIFPEIVVAQR